MRITIADDSIIVREGLKRLLQDAGLEICAESADAEQCLDDVARTLPDVAIIDMRMPPTHTTEGLQAAKTIRSRHPTTSVLVLSQYIDSDYALDLLNSTDSRCGYLLKERITQRDDLCNALTRLAHGETVIDQALIETLIAREPRVLDPLSEREREVLALLAQGLTDRGIAERLWLSPRTVETHVRHVLDKLDLPDHHTRNRRVEAALLYLRATTATTAAQ